MITERSETEKPQHLEEIGSGLTPPPFGPGLVRWRVEVPMKDLLANTDHVHSPPGDLAGPLVRHGIDRLRSHIAEMDGVHKIDEGAVVHVVVMVTAK